MVLLYIPPVQNLLRREVTAYASEATGMQIQVERILSKFVFYQLYLIKLDLRY